MFVFELMSQCVNAGGSGCRKPRKKKESWWSGLSSPASSPRLLWGVLHYRGTQRLVLHAGVGTAPWAELSPMALQHPLTKTEWGHPGCWYHLLAPRRALHQLSCICKQSETRQQIPIQTQGSFKTYLLPACYGGHRF